MSDEFDEFDLSEFTPEEFALVDTNILRMLNSDPQSTPRETSSAAPALDVVLESSEPSSPKPQGAPSKMTYPFQPATEDSPYTRFCSWKKTFAVTELVFPLWCEIQYEYGLWGEMRKPLHLRPETFISRRGKTMRVQRDRAVTSNRRLKRGKSTHQALEDEHRPKKLVVTTNTPEERFGLRLVQLITGFNEIIVGGKTRELPVFGIIHGYPVLGFIDEVVKIGFSDIKEQTSDDKVSQSGSPLRKRQRTTSPSSFDHSASNPSDSVSSNVHSTPQTDVPQLPHVSSQDAYALRLIDYKTRRAEYLPPEEDSLSPKLQLMLYHRMLTALLTPETIDFEYLWRFMELDPTKPFSSDFVRDVQMEDSSSAEKLHMDLHYLVSEWVSVVQEQMGHLQGVNADLQLIYRRALDLDNSVETNEPLQALALQEEQEVTRAITQKLRQFGKDGEDANNIAREVVQRIRATYPPECSPSVWSQAINSGPEQEDVHLVWAIQESLLSCAELAKKASTLPNKSVANGNTSCGMSGSLEAKRHDAPQDMSRMSPVIGTRTFRMDDGQLDAFLHDILQWWLGGRPAKGVSVTNSYRCFTCEHQNLCEWREEKAKEAVVALEKKKLANIA